HQMISTLKTAALVLFAVLSGCSWVMQGTSQEVEFSSEPDGATFTLNGKTETTPAKIAVPKSDYTLTCQREGFKDADVELRRKVNPWFYGSIAMGAIASVVDLATGS